MLTEEEKKALEEATKKIEEKRKLLKSHVKLNKPLKYVVMGWNILKETYSALKTFNDVEKAILEVKDYQYYGKICYIDIIDSSNNKIGKVTIR